MGRKRPKTNTSFMNEQFFHDISKIQDSESNDNGGLSRGTRNFASFRRNKDKKEEFSTSGVTSVGFSSLRRHAALASKTAASKEHSTAALSAASDSMPEATAPTFGAKPTLSLVDTQRPSTALSGKRNSQQQQQSHVRIWTPKTDSDLTSPTSSTSSKGRTPLHHNDIELEDQSALDSSDSDTSQVDVMSPNQHEYLSHCTVPFLRLSWRNGSRFGPTVFPHRLETEFAISEPHYEILISDLSRTFRQEYYSTWMKHKLWNRALYATTALIAAIFVVAHVLVVVCDQLGVFPSHAHFQAWILYIILLPVHLLWIAAFVIVILWRSVYPAVTKKKRSLILRAQRCMYPMIHRANAKKGVFGGKLKMELHVKDTEGVSFASSLFHGAYSPHLMIYKPSIDLLQYDLEDRAKKYIKQSMELR